MSQISIGLIGAGTIASNHLQALRAFGDTVRLAAVCDVSAAQLQRRAREYALDCPLLADYRALLKDPPDAVVVALPHCLHAEVALECLNAGCHVLLEKPMATSLEDCRRLVRAAAATRRALLVSEQCSYDAGALLTAEKFTRGDLGAFLQARLAGFRYYFRESRPAWFLDPEKSGGGMFCNLGVHSLALVRTALPGKVPIAVCAAIGMVPEYRIEACAAVLVKYRAGGAVYHEKIGYYPSTAELAAPSFFAFEDGLVTWNPDTWRLVTRQGATFEEPLPKYDPFVKIYEQLLDAMRGAAYRPKPEIYAADLAIVFGAYASGRTGKEFNLSDEFETIAPAAPDPGETRSGGRGR